MIGPYESRSVYAPLNDSDLLHGGPVGREVVAFRAAVAAAQSPEADEVPPAIGTPSLTGGTTP